ncbi:MAG: NBR1-Ig-like domain-containing protein [Chloroflexota bacterium]
MAKYLSKFRILLAIVLVIGLAFVLASACSFGGGVPTTPATFGIITPAENTRILIQGPVQIQSAFANPATISRVELWIKGETDPSETLLRSDRPTENGVVLQEWRPEQTGNFAVTVRAYNTGNQQLQTYTRRLVITDEAGGIVSGAQAGTELVEEIQFPTVTPSPPPVAGPAEVAQITVVATLTPTPSPTPIRRYPPPPPIPGVPSGPTQAHLPKLHPPVCDAAEYLGPFTGDTARRIVITEDDDVAAKVVGGTNVFRGFRLRNTGTCTWGPGYELAFYGGRAMGSGGVAFESIFPAEPARRNAPVDTDRLIVPQGKPNQIAVVELMLQAPVIPGIHQSYWRMRNPQGVYFGPIVGVTMEVVRDCQPVRGGPTLYGAPIVNKFEILGAGDVYRPFDPTNVIIEVTEPVVLDYNIINATNFDIVIEDPTGNIESRSTTSASDRVNFTPNRLGRYTVTLYADNGACTVQARVFIDVIPRAGEQFKLDLILASSAPVSLPADAAGVSTAPDVPEGTIQTQWVHYDKEINEITFHADLYKRERKTPLFDECVKVPLFDEEMEVLCGWSSWQRVDRSTVPIQGAAAAGAASVWDPREGDPRLPVEIQGTEIARMTEQQQARFIFCRLPESDNVQYGVKYYVEAEKDGDAADPPRSNEIDIICGETEEVPTSFNP